MNKTTEELFHLNGDRYEMTVQTANREYASRLNEMRRAYDAALAGIEQQVISGHDYEKYRRCSAARFRENRRPVR